MSKILCCCCCCCWHLCCRRSKACVSRQCRGWCCLATVMLHANFNCYSLRLLLLLLPCLCRSGACVSRRCRGWCCRCVPTCAAWSTAPLLDICWPWAAQDTRCALGLGTPEFVCIVFTAQPESSRHMLPGGNAGHQVTPCAFESETPRSCL
jgi:hypothetical protein